MKEFTGWQYLLIDVANNYFLDLDKKTFEERIDWTTKHLDHLESLAFGSMWKERPLFLKAVQAVRKAQHGFPTGHLVGLDAVCSGMQIMSAVTGCIPGATATGLVDPNTRSDAYTECTALMTQILGHKVPGDRKSVKNAVMTSLYGSKQQPKNEFGEDTPELDAFYKAIYQMAPGAWELLQDLLDSWQAYALEHSWELPDGFQAKIKTMKRGEERIEVDELAHSTFTYVFYENAGVQRDKKNAANVIHSIDAYILRSLVRRCTYNRSAAIFTSQSISIELLARLGNQDMCNRASTTVVGYPSVARYMDLYYRTKMVDPVILPFLDQDNIRQLPTEYLVKLNSVLHDMLEHAPFEVVTVHDDFRAHPNNLNHLRKHYRTILADLADSTILDDIFSSIHQVPGVWKKQSNNLGDLIRNSNYALC